jgi:hypothetical protein
MGSPAPTIGVASDIILTGGNRIRVTMPAELVVQGIGAAIQAEKLFATFPRIAGDILIALDHIAAVQPVLRGDAEPEADPEPPARGI